MKLHIIVVLVIILFLSSLQSRTQKYLSEEVEANLILYNSIKELRTTNDKLLDIIKLIKKI